MTPVPCFTDSCSVNLGFDPVTGLNANVILNPAGALDCNNGLEVLLTPASLAGTPVGQLDACDNLLGRTLETNSLFARWPKFDTFRFGHTGPVGGELVQYGQNKLFTLNNNLHNPGTCDLLVIFQSEYIFAFNATKDPVSGDRFFNADLTFKTYIGCGGAAAIVDDFSENVNGVTPNTATPNPIILTWSRTVFYTLAAGASENIRMGVARNAQGPSYDGKLNDPRFQFSIRGVAIELKPGTLVDFPPPTFCS